MTPAEQLNMLRRMGIGARISGLKTVLSALLAGLLLAGVMTDSPPFFMAAFFVAVVTWSAWQTSPHIRHAVQALQSGRRINGNVSISISEWSDSRSYRARVEDPQGSWSFEFIPQGWHPSEGRFEAALYRVDGVPWPALIVLKEGILFPRSIPQENAGA
jgi:hypothetical protein